MRVFPDTNVLVSAFATRGLSADLIEAVLVEHEMVTGRRVLKEFERALRTKLELPAALSAELVEFVAGEAALVVEGASPAPCDADDDDRWVLGEALAGKAQVFVTGDAGLVEIGSVSGLRILTPRQLWELLSKDESAGP